MRIFLHIGRARTGSTAFQNGMAAARKRLAEDGIVYPATRKNDARHMPLFWSAAADRLGGLHPWHSLMHDGLPMEARVAATIAEAGDADTLVLSCEWFSVAFEEGIYAPLVDALARHGDVTAIIVLRDQGEVLLSAWCRQIMDRTSPGRLEDMTPRKADWDKEVAPLDHHALVSGWAGMCNVALLHYSRDSARRVADICGVPPGIGFPTQSKSIPLELGDFLRARLHGNTPPDQWRKLVDRVVAEPGAFADFVRPEIKATAEAIKSRMTEMYAESNQRLESEFSHLFSAPGPAKKPT